jgi:hypothetical protein
MWKEAVIGRAIAQAVSRWLPTAAVRLRAQVWSCGICGGQSGAGAGFLPVLLCPLPIFIPPIAPQSPLCIIWCWYSRPVVAAVPSGPSLTALRTIKEKIKKRSWSNLRCNTTWRGWGKPRINSNRAASKWKWEAAPLEPTCSGRYSVLFPPVQQKLWVLPVQLVRKLYGFETNKSEQKRLHHYTMYTFLNLFVSIDSRI